MQSKRCPERVTTDWHAYIRHGVAGQCSARTLDLSRAGILVVTDGRLKVGDLFEVDVITSPQTFFRGQARVERVAYKKGRQVAYGARFVDMTHVDHEILAAGINKARPIHTGTPLA